MTPMMIASLATTIALSLLAATIVLVGIREQLVRLCDLLEKEKP